MKVLSIAYRCPVDNEVYVSDDPENGFYVGCERDGQRFWTVWNCPCGAEIHGTEHGGEGKKNKEEKR